MISKSKIGRKRFKERSKILKILSRIPLPFSPTRWGGSVLLAQAYFNHMYSSQNQSKAWRFFEKQNNGQTVTSTTRLTKYVESLEPYLEALNQSESNKSFISEILVQFSHLTTYASSQDQRSFLGRCLCDETVSRYESYVENESLLMSTYLDPRFSYVPDLLMRVRWTEIEESIALYSESLIIVPTSAQPPVPKKAHVEESSYAKFVQSKRLSVGGSSIQAEMASYKALVVAGRPALDSDPVTFWRAHRDRFPLLQRIALHFLSPTQSSAIVERLFSVCGSIVNNSRRNRMKPKTLNQQLLCAALATLESTKKNTSTTEEFDALLGNELATFALYCDPRFSYLPGILKNITWSNIENEVETYCGSIRVVTTDANGASHVAPPAPKKVKDDGSFFSRFFSSRRDVATTDSTRSEVVSYQSMIQSLRPPTSSDPLHFWALNAEKFPNLSVLANHSLASPSSAAPVERLFRKGLRDDDDSEESSEENIDDEDDGNNNNSFNPANTASYSSAVQSVPPPIPINSFSSPPVLSASPQPLINSHSSPSSVPSASPISPISPPSPNNS
ncbi:hypothetical protein L3Y34_003606 [Caenorhabditis briggsae]|uniref:HAT C-terminal dimerisation domain-containing protein n=1 Tax=Caenorhabditis briggsae TaxID=6238 RepID=A0AAE9ABT2_CAEBR|nr:hypothetical protein L3Y34_003606 [Caenorhabditis briggsae]